MVEEVKMDLTVKDFILNVNLGHSHKHLEHVLGFKEVAETFLSGLNQFKLKEIELYTVAYRQFWFKWHTGTLKFSHGLYILWSFSE